MALEIEGNRIRRPGLIADGVSQYNYLPNGVKSVMLRFCGRWTPTDATNRKTSDITAPVDLCKAVGGYWVLEADHLTGTTTDSKIFMDDSEVLHANQ
jgi:hypothetical protein